MKIDVLTLFPDFFSNLNSWSMIGRAVEENIVEMNYIDIRDFSLNKHRKVDDYPFGGGPGMVMTPEPIHRCLKSINSDNAKVIYMSPQGRKMNQELANELAKEEHLVLLCGHYEGIDNRIIENYVDEEISLGDFVLTGGEIPAMALIDSVVRLLPGVLSTSDSFEEESHYNGLLEHPQYTRPREYEGHEVPEVLLSGNHKKIDEWKRYKSLENTFIKRPDLLKEVELDKKDRKYLKEIKDNIE